MAQAVRLNGGPWHGRLTAVPDGHNHFHIRELVSPTADFDQLVDGTVQYREGTYSQVAQRPGEYEWDGWVTHE